MRSAIDDKAKRANDWRDARCGMAVMRTRNVLQKRTPKVALGPCADVAGDNRKCDRLGGSAMIALAIVRTLILVLFGLTAEESNERQFSQ